jgi:murein DD-endopeptidase MepM/ murein hydrolase activator NlpD
MCWPLQDAAFANSQVYGHGGGMGPAGTSQCDTVNYALPWHDTFCEARSRDNPLCAGGGTGHQGQDIRPATCKKNLHWAVAAEKGVITDIGSYTVTLTASALPHRTYRYLHMQMAALAVKEGDTVVAGQKLGKVANDFGGTPTTIHLHFEMRAGVAGLTTDGKPVVLHTFLPPYMSLAEAYQRKLNGGTCP